MLARPVNGKAQYSTSRPCSVRPGTLFLYDVQAHGIEDQTNVNDSRINDGDLVEAVSGPRLPASGQPAFRMSRCVSRRTFAEDVEIQEGVSFAEDVGIRGYPSPASMSPDGTTAFVSLQENNAIAEDRSGER